MTDLNENITIHENDASSGLNCPNTGESVHARILIDGDEEVNCKCGEVHTAREMWDASDNDEDEET